MANAWQRWQRSRGGRAELSGNRANGSKSKQRISNSLVPQWETEAGGEPFDLFGQHVTHVVIPEFWNYEKNMQMVDASAAAKQRHQRVVYVTSI